MNNLVKFFLIVLLICSFFTDMFSQNNKKKELNNLLFFEQELQDIGDVIKGKKKEVIFNFTNTSIEHVKIDMISACSCLKLEYPTDGIKPGEKGRIKALFDTSEKIEDDYLILDIFLENKDKKGLPISTEVKFNYTLITRA